tara:strand:- start:131 stop:1501 length:1371 start_codon:yes stop_codon:yes gene_type:complete
VQNLNRLNINFNKEDIKDFLFSKRFLFQSVDRVVFLDENYRIIADTNTLDLDPRSFSQRIDIVEFDIVESSNQNNTQEKKFNEKKKIELIEKVSDYALSTNFGKPYTFTTETYQQFKLSTVKNLIINDNASGYLMISESANEIKTAINERKTFVIRTAIFVGIVIFIFSLVLNRYFLKPIKNLVNFTQNIKERSKKKIDLSNLINRNDELGMLTHSLDEMTNELQKRVNTAENFSTDLVHEIRNPLASLKSASEILSDTNSNREKEKLIKILSHDVERIERLITDYSQMLKDEVAITKEQMTNIDLEEVIKSVVDDFNGIYISKRGIKINFKIKKNGDNYYIKGIENRIEQVLANLLENSISFSEDNKKIIVELKRNKNNKIQLSVVDEGKGFKEKNTDKIFKRFYSNRPEKFGEHSGLGLNIVKNLVDLHGGSVNASNNKAKNGARVDIYFPIIN